MQQAGIIDPRALQQARQNPRVQMAEGLASSGIAGALKELIDDRVTMEAMELVAAADRDEAAKMTDKPSIKDSNTQGINQLVQTLAPGMQLRNNQIQKAQMQKMLGLGGQPAPNMRMADGGIVGFEEGDKVEGATEDRLTPMQIGQQKFLMRMQEERERYQMLKDLEDKYMAEGNQEALNNVRLELENYKGSIAAQPPKPTPENTFQMADGGIVALKEGGFPDLSGDGKVTQKDILMGRGVVDKAEGGIIGLKEGGGILSRIIDYIRNIDFGGTSREADQFNKEVMQALNERNMEDTGIMAMVKPVDRPVGPTRPPETMTVPTRGEQFSQMFPDVRKAVNESEGTEMGGLKYLQMIGEMQEQAKEDEARRALNYLKMMASSQDMIDAADPAANIPKFAGPEGSLVKSQQEYADLGAEIQRLMDYEKTLPIFDDQRKLLRQRRSELGRQRDDMMPEQITPQYEAAQEEIARQAIAEQGFDLGTTTTGADNIEPKEIIDEKPLMPPSMEGFRSVPETSTVTGQKDGPPEEVGPETFRTEDFQETLALDPSTTGYEEKLDEIMQRANSPTRILATFLQGVGEGKTIGQGLMAGGKAIAAAERAYDAQEVQLRGLLEQQRISQQNFNINMQKIANEKEQLRIMDDNYERRAEISKQYNTLMSDYYTRASAASNAGNRIELASAISEARGDFNAVGSGLKEAFIREVAINATRSPDGNMLNTRQLEDYIEDNEAALAAQAEELFLRTTFQELYRPNTGMVPRGAGSVGPSITPQLQSEAAAIVLGE
jgi:hypothetical protein